MIVTFTAAAEADLEAIGDCIDQADPDRALRFLRELCRRCLELDDSPEAWPTIPRYEHHGIRRMVHGRYLIFYRVAGSRVAVLHVLNGAMEIEPILFPDR